MQNKKELSLVLLVANWLLGIVFLIIGIASLFSSPFSSLLSLLIAFIFIPPTNKFIQDKGHIRLSKWPKMIAVLILLLIIGVSQPQGVSKMSSPKKKSAITINSLNTWSRGSVLSSYEVTYWDSNGNLVSKNNQGPLEVVVNSSMNKFSDCLSAKLALQNVMAEIYTDPFLKNKVSRVLFTAPYYLRASLGSADASQIKDWSQFGPSSFWSTTLGYASYEKELGPLNTRTWGKDIGDCK